jgi:hypothetical protein
MKRSRPPTDGVLLDAALGSIRDNLSPTARSLLMLAGIQASTPYQRELLGAYSRAVIELSRCVVELERMKEPAKAATLARYASEVTYIACEHVTMSAEIHQEPQ